MNIYEKMSCITQEIATVAKNLSVGVGKSQYKAVGEADVLAAVKPIEAKYKVYSYPVDREIVDSGEIVSTTNYNGQTQEKRQLYLRLRTIYRFVNIEKPDEFVDVPTYGDGVDSQDKATGKAMTYSDKYALLKAYKIQTGDDPDQHYSDSLVKKESTPYPDKKRMAADVEAYIKKDTRAADWIKDAMSRAKANRVEDLDSALITACWNKWCQK